jgi:hypothetical protein
MTIELLTGDILVESIHQERIGSIIIPDTGKPTTYGRVVRSSVPDAVPGDEVLHLPWGRPLDVGGKRYWLMSWDNVVASRHPGDDWQVTPGWLAVKIVQESRSSLIESPDAKAGNGEGQLAVAMTGPYAGDRVVYKVLPERVVTMWSGQDEIRIIKMEQLLCRISNG